MHVYAAHPVSHSELGDVDIIRLRRIFLTHWRTAPCILLTVHLARLRKGQVHKVVTPRPKKKDISLFYKELKELSCSQR